MGPPPVDFLLQCGEKADQFWDENGPCGKISIPLLGQSYPLLTLQSRHLEKPGPNPGYKLGAHGSKTGRQGETTIHILYEENVAMGPRRPAR